MIIDSWKNRIITANEFDRFHYDESAMDSDVHPYAMIYFLIDEIVMIAVGCDPLSPKEFLEKNRSNCFMLDESIPPKMIAGGYSERIIYYASIIESK